MLAFSTLSIEEIEALAKLARWLTGAGSGLDEGVVLLEAVMTGGWELTAGDLRLIARLAGGAAREGHARTHGSDVDDEQVVAIESLAEWIREGGWSAAENEAVLGGMDEVSIDDLKVLAGLGYGLDKARCSTCA